MSHLRPLTVTWSSRVWEWGTTLHTEVATAFLPRPPAWPPGPLAPQPGPSWLGRCPLRPTGGEGPKSRSSAVSRSGRPCSALSAPCFSSAGAAVERFLP